MKYLYNFLITSGLSIIAFYVGSAEALHSVVLSWQNFLSALVFGGISGVFVFLLILPVLIWIKKYRNIFIGLIDFIGFIVIYLFSYGLVSAIASV